MTGADQPATPWRTSEHGLGLGVLALTVLVYAFSLAGDWVWDDVFQYRGNPAITKPLVLISNDIWGPTGYAPPNAMPVYRPLAMLSHVPGQTLLPGPTVERALNLALHLGIVAGVAWLVAALGANRRAAWFGAAVLAWHPAVTESVAWISSRGDLMGSLLVLLGMIALQRDRAGWSGLCFALAPFCKETFAVAPVALALWMIALRKKSVLAPAIASGGALAYFAVRAALQIPLPSNLGGDAWTLLGAIGAVAVRGIELMVSPFAPDVLPSFVSNPVAGIVALAVVIGGLAALAGRPALGLFVAPLPFLALAVPASLANQLIADRYFYIAAVGVAAAAGCGYEYVQAHRSWAPALFGIPLLLAPVASARAGDWQSNHELFSKALERHPDSPHALFQLAYDLHVARGDCDGAVPLYRRAMSGSERAGNNLQACLFTMGRDEEAADLGPELARQDPVSAIPALNTARAFARLGRMPEAMDWAREALRREPESKRCHVVLGQILGEQGRFEDALRSFERALAIAPGDPDALRGLQLAQHMLSAASAGRHELSR